MSRDPAASPVHGDTVLLLPLRAGGGPWIGRKAFRNGFDAFEVVQSQKLRAYDKPPSPNAYLSRFIAARYAEGNMTPDNGPRFRVYLDFDGTLVTPNVAIDLVGRFAPNGAAVAKEVDDQLHSGQITLRQAWERQAALLPPDRIPEMTKFCVDNIPLRQGAHEMLSFFETARIPVVVLSGGLDFYIRAILAREGLNLPFLSDTMERTAEGTLRVQHPYGHPTCVLCGICKAQAVQAPAPLGVRTIFIGDGSTDRFAAEVTDLVFARRRLLQYCHESMIPVFPFETFEPVTEKIRAWVLGLEPVPAPRSLGLAESRCPISRELHNASFERSLTA